MNKTKLLVIGATSAVLTTLAHAQTSPTMPAASDVTTAITSIAGAAAAAAALGLSIWVYRKLKAKSNQAIG